MKSSEPPSNQINGRVRQQNDLIFTDCNQQSFLYFKAFYKFILHFPWGVKWTKWNELGNQVECNPNTQCSITNFSNKFILAAYVYFVIFFTIDHIFSIFIIVPSLFFSQILLVHTYRFPNLLLSLSFNPFFTSLLRIELQK